ncbi:MAG: endolytic transglycosylase MltG [Clostridiales bacterium]|jgi:UPF0755 protein|nr:endolytic transglycosylase MltG [Clostridiales bacterium]
MKTKRLKFILIIISILIAWAAIACASDYFGIMRPSTKISVNIPQGAATDEISALLRANNIIKNRTLFKLTVVSSGAASDFKAGDHVFAPNMGYPQIIRILTQIPSESGIKIVIPEGYEANQIASLLEEKGLTSAKEFLYEIDNGTFDYPFMKYISRKKNRLEGYLFPATYTIPTTATARDIIIQMLNAFDAAFDASCYQKAEQLGMTPDEIVTLASIVEREAAGDADRAKVSSVFHNRLNSGSLPYLQSCATVQYILGERKPVLSIADTQINSPYNTYMNKGLPVGPIASPGKASILAALNPAKTDYYYFVFTDGKHIFSRTLEEHNNAINN